MTRQRWKVEERINQLLPLVVLAHNPPTTSKLARVMGVGKRSVERYAEYEMRESQPLLTYTRNSRGVKFWTTTSYDHELRAYALSNLDTCTPLGTMLSGMGYERIMEYLSLVNPEQCAQIHDYAKWFKVVDSKVDVDTIQSYLCEAHVPYALQHRWAYLIAGTM